MKIRSLVIVFLLILFASASVYGRIVTKNFEAQYKFDFSGFVVGKGTLKAIFKNDNLTILFKGRTVSLIKLLYRLNVEILDAVNLKTLRDMFYKSWSETKKRKKFVYVTFDNSTHVKVVYDKNGDKKTYSLSNKDGLCSPLNVYLFFLTHNYELRKTYVRYVVVSKHVYKVLIKPLSYETINLDDLSRDKGKRKALKVEIKFFKVNSNGKVAKKSSVKDLMVWISEDPPQIPLLIRMWHVIGVFEAKLTKLTFN